MHPGKPGIAAFWQLVSMYLFLVLKLLILLARIELKTFLSIFNRAFFSDLIDGMGVLLFGNEHINNLLPLFWGLFFLPSCFHELP